MKKTIAMSLILFNFMAVGAYGAVGVEKNQLILQNFVDTRCQTFKPSKPILKLDETYYNKMGYRVGATSCKGEVCWSWSKKEDAFDWKLYSSNLPLRVNNVEKLSKSITQTIKNSKSLKKDASSVVNLALEFLQNSFGMTKGRDIAKERAITETRTQESAVEINTTTLFHRFLAMGLQGAFTAKPHFCMASAVDLFYKAFNENRVNDLVEAFIFFQTISPEDVVLTEGKDLLNRAKLLYLMAEKEGTLDYTKRQFAWASALLFAKMLEWKEFKEVKKLVDDYIDKELEKQGFSKVQKQPEVGVKNTVLETKLDEKELKVAKVLKEKPAVVAGVGLGAGAVGVGVVGALYLRKRKLKNS
jgi:hypothetical protein